jgi:putative FmdB family regulatory protein
MPVYEYECKQCDAIFDMYFPLKQWDTEPYCPDCGGKGKKVFTSNIQRDEPTWLNDDVRNSLQDPDYPRTPIETRTQYKRFLKDNGIIERS